VQKYIFTTTTKFSYDPAGFRFVILQVFFRAHFFGLIPFTGQHWADVGNRRTFFTKFAKMKGFDPLNPKNWYKVTPESILSVKVLHFSLCFIPSSSSSSTESILSVKVLVFLGVFLPLSHPNSYPVISIFTIYTTNKKEERKLSLELIWVMCKKISYPERGFSYTIKITFALLC
jgi:hypothetical protein